MSSVSGLPPTVHCDGTGTIVSPCEPRVRVFTERTDTPSSSATKFVNRAVSSTPAWPSTRLRGNPVAIWVNAVISSSGLDTTMTTAFGRVLRHVLGHAAHDLRVDLEQVHPAHARLARQARGDHHDVRALDGLVALAVGRGGRADDFGLEALDRARLVQIERQALGPALDDVGQHDRFEHVVLGEALRGGRAVEAGADDGDLFAHEICNSRETAVDMRTLTPRHGLVGSALQIDLPESRRNRHG